LQTGETEEVQYVVTYRMEQLQESEEISVVREDDSLQTSVLSDHKSFVDKISSFFNQQTLSDVMIQVFHMYIVYSV